MKKEIDANELFELIKKFIHISINSIAGSKPGEFSKNYRNTKIKVSFYSMHGGNSKFQNAPTFTFLNYGQKVTHGIYPIICSYQRIFKKRNTQRIKFSRIE